MALPMLVGGADCGPINPLQGLSKEFERDRGLQQVTSCDQIAKRNVALTLHRRTTLAQDAQDRQSRYVYCHFWARVSVSCTCQTFRTQYGGTPAADQDAARFFAGPSAGPSTMGPTPYDLSLLHGALPPLQSQSPVSAQSPAVMSPGVLSPAPAHWASDFLQHQPVRNNLSQTFRTEAEQTSTQLRQTTHTPLEAAGVSSPFQGETDCPLS